MSINLHSQLELDTSYKLLQLTPDLLNILTNPEYKGDELKFKSLHDNGKSDVVLCSKEKTWSIKQKNHSNTVLLMKEFVPEDNENDDGEDNDRIETFNMPRPINDFLGFTKTTFEYETRLSKGEINLEMVPVYDGEKDFFDHNNTKGKKKNGKISKLQNMSELIENSCCSEKECLEQWNRLGGCEINGYVCLLSSDFLSKSLHVVLMSVMAEQLNMDQLTVDETFNAIDKDVGDGFSPYTREVVKTVLNKFGTSISKNEDKGTRDVEKYRLDTPEITKWYGILALKKYVSRSSMALDEFLIKWKSLFPPFFPCNLDIAMLRGWHFKESNLHDDIGVVDNTNDRHDTSMVRVQYISRDTLSMDPKQRFQRLFSLQSRWDMEDLWPFVEELNIRGLKPDSFVAKFARRRKVGRRVVISSRG
ncbi:Dcc1p NDAI_0G04210 [Naumovozyma dairenensis CBS 421]|uniref:Sister chromatid cohesion protein DCC1 n=1 Tax=Naumovozyma dairenensis (strain ATCC 10597 / BCRC 20456 / CBS 421 / NBRC 0211 / NRRL Y-12639) TaxID=1071378 RepID=J7S4E3_NAUDC|nr:hypothetical protein NDAI_0G04210 [Naumovozyma dairenensis CBS 421]CCK73406.1 hypothetical protein NDAI_0G04210 [Naumovozyma dairenensis CBS 421]